MHRRRMRKYRIQKDICLLIGGSAMMALIGIVGGYETGAMTTLMYIMEILIAVDVMMISYMAYNCVRCKECRYLKLRELRKRQKQQKLKKSA